MTANGIQTKDRLLHIGELNTERGVSAKRNLFVFCATYLFVFFVDELNLEELTIFGMTPFAGGATKSYYVLLIIFLYLLIYWAYHYYQG